MTSRRAELAANLARVQERIASACRASGRDPGEITLIAVTKFFPASDAAILAELGLADLGENRDQEAAAKANAVAELTQATVRWHFVGQLQTNKARSVARYAAVVHSVDRPQLVTALSNAVTKLDRPDPLQVLIQVSLDGDLARGGVPIAGVEALADTITGSAGLHLAGLMAVAPLGGDPDLSFGQLARCATELRRKYPDAGVISAGMSADLEAAIRHGATHVRIGTALLGRRAPVFG